MNSSSLLLALAILVGAANPALAQIPSGTQGPGGQGPPGTTFGIQAIPATSTKITLVAPSAYLTIVNTSTSVTLYYSSVSPATTTASFAIVPNASYSYAGVPLYQFYVIGSAGSADNFTYTAH